MEKHAECLRLNSSCTRKRSGNEHSSDFCHRCWMLCSTEHGKRGRHGFCTALSGASHFEQLHHLSEAAASPRSAALKQAWRGKERKGAENRILEASRDFDGREFLFRLSRCNLIDRNHQHMPLRHSHSLVCCRANSGANWQAMQQNPSNPRINEKPRFPDDCPQSPHTLFFWIFNQKSCSAAAFHRHFVRGKPKLLDGTKTEKMKKGAESFLRICAFERRRRRNGRCVVKYWLLSFAGWHSQSGNLVFCSNAKYLKDRKCEAFNPNPFSSPLVQPCSHDVTLVVFIILLVLRPINESQFHRSSHRNRERNERR